MSEDTPLPEVATLSESTVQAIAKGEVDQTPKPRRKGPEKPPAVLNEHHIRVDPMLWEIAKKIQREGTRLVIVSATEVREINVYPTPEED